MAPGAKRAAAAVAEAVPGSGMGRDEPGRAGPASPLPAGTVPPRHGRGRAGIAPLWPPPGCGGAGRRLRHGGARLGGGSRGVPGAAGLSWALREPHDA